jgi:hypothetical protein
MADKYRARAVSLDFHDSSDDEAILYEDDEHSDLDDGPMPRLSPHQHPIVSMQGPFEESISDSAEQVKTGKPPLQFSKLSAEERRERLLAGEEYNDTYTAMWREDARTKYHPLTKVLAQISYGVHLLHTQGAVSTEDVIAILQRHIDEVDEFISRADEDLGMALADIATRVDHLRFALEDAATFDLMLQDRSYRVEILKGNETIDNMISRTTDLMSDLLADIRCGTESIQDMAAYMSRIGATWPTDTTDLGLYNTMMANTEGWLECFESLKLEGNSLGAALVQLGGLINEISQRAGIASRKQVSCETSFIVLISIHFAP